MIYGSPIKQAAKTSPASQGSTAKSPSLRLLQELLEPQVTPVDRSAPTDEPQILVPQKRLRFRHKLLVATCALVVAVPTIATGTYMAFFAADQYHSTASFSVRSMDSAQASDILGVFTQASTGSTSSDSYVLLDYIRSEKMVQRLETQFDLDAVFGRRGLDFFYGLAGNLPIEEKVEYWRNMVDVSFDHTSGILNLEVKAFTPEDARAVAGFVVQESEKVINDLSLSARNEVLAASQQEVELAEERLARARAALQNFRAVSQEADPIEGAKLAAQLIATLEQRLVQLQTELQTALNQMGEDTPRIRVMRSEIESLEAQIEAERQRFGAGPAAKGSRNGPASSGVAGRIQRYDVLETEREFAERTYTSALTSLERARMDVSGRQRYLAVFIEPTLSELSQYPSRIWNTILVFIACVFTWSLGAMAYYNIRDRN